jgi:hypothetical protein
MPTARHDSRLKISYKNYRNILEAFGRQGPGVQILSPRPGILGWREQPHHLYATVMRSTWIFLSSDLDWARS